MKGAWSVSEGAWSVTEGGVAVLAPLAPAGSAAGPGTGRGQKGWWHCPHAVPAVPSPEGAAAPSPPRWHQGDPAQEGPQGSQESVVISPNPHGMSILPSPEAARLNSSTKRQQMRGGIKVPSRGLAHLAPGWSQKQSSQGSERCWEGQGKHQELLQGWRVPEPSCRSGTSGAEASCTICSKAGWRAKSTCPNTGLGIQNPLG